jgi:hypothetical protein
MLLSKFRVEMFECTLLVLYPDRLRRISVVAQRVALFCTKVGLT